MLTMFLRSEERHYSKLNYRKKMVGESLRFAYRLFARLILFAIGYIILTTSIGCFPICFRGRRWNIFQ